jgi:hypothetical protein
MDLNKGQTNFWMIAFFILLIGAAFLLGGYYPNFFSKTSRPTPAVIVQEPTTTPTLLPTETTVPSPSIAQKSDVEGIKEAFAKKYNKPVDQVEVSISKNNGTQATGGIKFAGEMGGAFWLAYKQADGWIIVHDGQGTISCETIAPYNFPSSMVSECVDKNGKLIKK